MNIPDTLQTRPITSEDETRWRELWAAYLAFYKVDLAENVTASVWSRLMSETDPLGAFVCIGENNVIGFTHYFFHGTTWHPTSYCYLEDLFVDQTIRSKGAGRALINAVKEAAHKEGAAKLYWHTDEQNKTAQALYNKVATLTDFIRYDIAL